ncbi:MAG: polymer-forming cytoskeletal protein [Deltaproteobacteria bacterium]|nr:polymer-forming cytoskeletal protein [Deltaproteobacteria bacterium]
MFGKDDKKKQSQVMGFIGKGMSIEGRLIFEDTVRIDGNFKGDISTPGTLIVGEGGYIEGRIKAGRALVTGEIRGTLEAATRVELKSPCRLFGEIRTPNLIIGEGVIFDGNCVMMNRDRSQTESMSYTTISSDETPIQQKLPV